MSEALTDALLRRAQSGWTDVWDAGKRHLTPPSAQQRFPGDITGKGFATALHETGPFDSGPMVSPMNRQDGNPAAMSGALPESRMMLAQGLLNSQPSQPAPANPDPGLAAARQAAEAKYPFLKQFQNVIVQRADGDTRRGLGEFYAADEPENPNPGTPTIIVGPKSKDHPGGESAIIIADLIHAATDSSPEVQALKKELVSNFSEAELRLAKRRYEEDFKGKFTGSNFSTFDNFLNRYWADGVLQMLLLEEEDLAGFQQHNPAAHETLKKIQRFFGTEAQVGN